MIAIEIKQLGDASSTGYRAKETIYEQMVEDKDFNLKAVIATINGLVVIPPSCPPPGSIHLIDQQ